jgi:alanyl-tRNA synthetase
MVKTKELYYESAYTDQFDATVISSVQGEDDCFFVTLDQTAFFPEQGGQSCDQGQIIDEAGQAHTVKHVSISDGIITHVMDSALEVGSKVHGSVSFEHRFSNMQQHTGEHIFSGIVHSLFGYDNVGFHLSDSEVTMDYNGPLTSEDIERVETLVNEAIWKNVPVLCEFPTKEELKDIDYRSKKELSGDIRIVTIPGFDVCACCAPHVSSTGEVGLLKVVKCQNYKGGVRVSILCGRRALLYIRQEQQVVEELTALLTTGRDRITESVRRMSGEIYDLKGQISDLRGRVLEYELEKLDPGLSDVFLVKEEGLEAGLMRNTVNALVSSHDGYCGVFSGNDTQGYKYVIATGAAGKDITALQDKLRNDFGARGGGKGVMVQGSLPAGCIISDVLDHM